MTSIFRLFHSLITFFAYFLFAIFAATVFRLVVRDLIVDASAPSSLLSLSPGSGDVSGILCLLFGVVVTFVIWRGSHS